MYSSLSIACLLIISSANAIPKTGEDSGRIIDNDLSQAAHYENDRHNIQYDHEAFLGEDQAKTFDDLSPDESSRRLGVIYDKIDKNEDKFVDLAELKAWIEYTKKRYVHDDVERQWQQHNPEKNETISWPEYKKAVYGFMDEMDAKDLDLDEGGISYHKMMSRDRRRWAVADKNNDEKLTKEEFTDFLHPEESPYMRDIVVTETIEDIDKNNDGKVSIDEYIGDMYKGEEGDDDEPDWVRNERDIFVSFRDKDKDGVMDAEEVKDWIIPSDFDHAEAEARHLIYEADTDSDEKLTKEEVLDKYDLFVGSQATDFGEVLVRHDEF